MSVLLRVLTGARIGHVLTTDEPVIRIGREVGVDLRFDPENDLEVSARHANITWQNHHWQVHDLGSRNGTFVNGRRIDACTPLEDGDKIAFGSGGPVVEFHIINQTETRTFGVPDTMAVRSAAPIPDESPTTRIRAEVARHSRRWAAIVLAIALGFSAVIAVLVLGTRKERRAWEREREALVARTDSALAASDRAVQSLQGELKGLADALRASQQEVRATGANLASAERGGDAQVPALRDKYKRALATLSHQQIAAGLDHEAIRRRNAKAVARIFAESENGQVSGGSAFTIRPDGTMITNWHTVTAADGNAIRRLAIQFAYSDQVWPARVLAVDREMDLAIVKVDAIVGAVPTVQGLNLRPDTVRARAPVLLIGFPLGGKSAPSDRAGRTMIQPVIGAGSVVSMSGRQIEVEGYGATGSSGSPIFDRNGEVIGIVFGGVRNARSQTVVGVPASAAARLLATVRP